MAKTEGLSTGVTLLNLLLRDDPYVALLPGHYYFVVGDSTAGKSLLCLSAMAEAASSRAFANYRLIYDDVEGGCLFDVPRMFGKRTARRLEPPQVGETGEPVHSATIEDFYYAVDDATQAGKPFVYVLDSMDGLTSEPSDEKFEQQKKAHRTGRSVPGSYGDAKAKINSERLRKVLKGVRETGSILIIVSQTRDNLGFGWEKKTRSGGRALRFYATAEIWLSVVKRLKKTVGGKDREVGVRVEAETKKNRMIGRTGEVRLDVYPSFGIDDTGSLVDYLVDEGVWKQSKQAITTHGLGIDKPMSREKLIRHIEQGNQESRLRKLAAQRWAQVIEEAAVKRKGRYA